MLLGALILLTMNDRRIEMDMVYSKVAGESLMMDVYFPEKSPKPSPAVLVIHGGAWMSGKRSDVADIAKTLADQGFVAATTSYRLAPKYKWPTMLDDVQTAVRFLRKNAENFHLDPAKIGSCGASAGGHLALLLGFRDTAGSPLEYPGLSSRTQAVFNIFGPTDFRRDFPASIDPLIVTLLGKKKENASEELRQASPVHWITKESAPVFTLHGDADPLVPVAQSKWLKERLDAAGVKNELLVVPKMGHGVDRSKPEQLKGMLAGAEWLKKHLGL